MARPSPQRSRVLRALLRGPKTSQEIIGIAPTSSPAGVIARIRAQGIAVVTVRRSGVNRLGERVSYAQWILTPAGRAVAHSILKESTQ